MKVGAFEILLFFVCLNLSCYILVEMEALPYYIEGIETTTSIETMTINKILGSIAIVIAGTFVGVLFNAVTQAAAIAMIVATLNYLIEVVEWILFGFPKLLTLFGVPSIIYTVLATLLGLVWFWFLIGIVAQRYME